MPNAGPTSEPRVFDKTIVTLLAVGFAAIGLTILVVNLTPNEVPVARSQLAATGVGAAPASSANRDANTVWATTAPGRVEPKGGTVRVRPEASGRILKVHTVAGREVVRFGLVDFAEELDGQHAVDGATHFAHRVLKPDRARVHYNAGLALLGVRRAAEA